MNFAKFLLDMCATVKVYSRLMALLIFAFACRAQPMYTLDELQGAWWSNVNSPTADFAINGAEVWLDFDASYHPCSISDGNILVFELGPGNDSVEHKLVSLDETTLVLENPLTHETTAYTRNE